MKRSFPKLQLIPGWVLVVSVAFAGTVVRPALAEMVSARQQVETTVERVKKEVASKKLPVKSLDKKLEEIIFPVFDFEAMARSTVAAHWDNADPNERKEFVDLFSRLLARTYLKRIRENIVDSTLEVTSEKSDGSQAEVQTVAEGKGERIKVDYKLHLVGGQWRVYDVKIENVGLVANYRTEFNSLIRKDGMAGLIAKLKEKEAKTAAAD